MKKNVDLKKYDGFEEPEDQISILNKLFNLESHAPTLWVNLTHPIAPWMKVAEIVSDRQKLEQSWIKSRDSNCLKDRDQYVEDKKKFKKSIKVKKIRLLESIIIVPDLTGRVFQCSTVNLT